ncbi:MAG: type II toxin-antitoxin system PemK/MazF family toxin [Bacteroidetes bacterium]|nr:type II toxin-antitoxin system PemK/MazF family toxin [Bacteroidota bacterium]
MERFIKGDVVIIPFPFSDLTNYKRRPALVLADLEGDDIILCQITSSGKYDQFSISLVDTDFESGGLPVNSNIRPNRIFTADKSLIINVVGKVLASKHQVVLEVLYSILK